MASNGEMKAQLGLVELSFLGIGTMIGSGWLFAAARSSSNAGTGAIYAWILGAIIVTVIGLVFAELGSSIPRAGGFIRYPTFTHGRVIGSVVGLSSLLSYTSSAGVEVEAVREYATFWWPGLSTANGTPSGIGFVMQTLLLLVFFLLNYWSVKALGRTNVIITIIKFFVPLATLLTLFAYFHPSNFSAPAPTGTDHGVFSSLTGAGIVFAYLGFRQSVDFGSEAKNPQRDIPLAIMIAIGVSFIIYLLLQIAFMGAIPPAFLAEHHWSGIAAALHSPYADLAQSLGITWLVSLILIDAVVSPAGTANIGMGGSARAIYAWAKNSKHFQVFAKVDAVSGVPRVALLTTLILGFLWTLPSQFQAWGGLINAATSSLVFTYIPGPVCLTSLRKSAPDMHRPFKLPFAQVLSPLGFIFSTCLIYWGGWAVNEVLIPILVIGWVLAAFLGKTETSESGARTSWWYLAFCIVMYVISWIGDYGGGHGWIPAPYDMVLVVIIALIYFYWGVSAAMPKADIKD